MKSREKKLAGEWSVHKRDVTERKRNAGKTPRRTNR